MPHGFSEHLLVSKRRQGLALACFETRVRFINDVNAAFPTNDPAIFVTQLG